VLGDAPELSKISLTYQSYCRTCFIPKELKGCHSVAMPKRNYLSFLATLNDVNAEIEGKKKILPGMFI
jgi:hypothetical protein